MEQKFHSVDNAFQSFRKGDRNAFGYLLERFYPALLLFADSLQPDPTRSEALVNSSWRKACGKYDNFGSLAELTAFIRKTIRNACTPPPYFRRPKKKEPVEKKDFVEFASGSPEATNHNTSLIDKAMGYFGPMPLKTRNILDLFYKEGKNASEIARRLGLTTQIVKARIEQARRSNLFMPDTDPYC